MELADMRDLGSRAQASGFDSPYPHHRRGSRRAAHKKQPFMTVAFCSSVIRGPSFPIGVLFCPAPVEESLYRQAFRRFSYVRNKAKLPSGQICRESMFYKVLITFPPGKTFAIRGDLARKDYPARHTLSLLRELSGMTKAKTAGVPPGNSNSGSEWEFPDNAVRARRAFRDRCARRIKRMRITSHETTPGHRHKPMIGALYFPGSVLGDGDVFESRKLDDANRICYLTN